MKSQKWEEGSEEELVESEKYKVKSHHRSFIEMCTDNMWFCHEMR